MHIAFKSLIITQNLVRSLAPDFIKTVEDARSINDTHSVIRVILDRGFNDANTMNMLNEVPRSDRTVALVSIRQ